MRAIKRDVSPFSYLRWSAPLLALSSSLLLAACGGGSNAPKRDNDAGGGGPAPSNPAPSSPPGAPGTTGGGVAASKTVTTTVYNAEGRITSIMIARDGFREGKMLAADGQISMVSTEETHRQGSVETVTNTLKVRAGDRFLEAGVSKDVTTYDGQGRRVEVQREIDVADGRDGPPESVETFSYDAEGRLVKFESRNRAGIQRRHTADYANSRLIALSSPFGTIENGAVKTLEAKFFDLEELADAVEDGEGFYAEQTIDQDSVRTSAVRTCSVEGERRRCTSTERSSSNGADVVVAGDTTEEKQVKLADGRRHWFKLSQEGWSTVDGRRRNHRHDIEYDEANRVVLFRMSTGDEKEPSVIETRTTYGPYGAIKEESFLNGVLTGRVEHSYE